MSIELAYIYEDRRCVCGRKPSAPTDTPRSPANRAAVRSQHHLLIALNTYIYTYSIAMLEQICYAVIKWNCGRVNS
jgi:hypothetical protein